MSAPSGLDNTEIVANPGTFSVEALDGRSAEVDAASTFAAFSFCSGTSLLTSVVIGTPEHSQAVGQLHDIDEADVALAVSTLPVSSVEGEEVRD